MGDYGFSLESLMELAGQSVAHATFQIGQKYLQSKASKIFIVAGSGSINFVWGAKQLELEKTKKIMEEMES